MRVVSDCAAGASGRWYISMLEMSGCSDAFPVSDSVTVLMCPGDDWKCESAIDLSVSLIALSGARVQENAGNMGLRLMPMHALWKNLGVNIFMVSYRSFLSFIPIESIAVYHVKQRDRFFPASRQEGHMCDRKFLKWLQTFCVGLVDVSA